MNALLKRLSRELVKTAQHPRRLFGLCNRKKVLEFMTTFDDPRHRWQRHPIQGFKARSYTHYDDYIRHQKSKLKLMNGPEWLAEYDVRFAHALRERLERDALLDSGMTVLCLGARLGSEVKAFLELGCLAIGLDLNPWHENRYVLHGDFHQIQYPAAVFDAIFTNSLDHVLDIEQVIKEIQRVLKTQGLLIVEAAWGEREQRVTGVGFHESFYWSTIDDLTRLFEQRGFALLTQSPIDYPWSGKHLCFRKRDDQRL